MENDRTELDNQPHQQSQHRAPPSQPSGMAHLMNPEPASQAGSSNSGNLPSPSRQQNNAHIPHSQQNQGPQAPQPQQLPNPGLPKTKDELSAWKTPAPTLPADDMPLTYRHRENVAVEIANDSSIRWTILFMAGKCTAPGKRLRHLVGYTKGEKDDFLRMPKETRKEDWASFPRFLKKELADTERAEKERDEAKADKERQEREQRKLKPIQTGFETKVFNDAPPISGAGNSATILDIYKIHFSVGLRLCLAFFLTSVMRLAVYQDRIKTRTHHKQNTKDATVVDENGTMAQLQLVSDSHLTIAQFDECSENMMATMESITPSSEAVKGGPTNKTAELLKHFTYFASISHRNDIALKSSEYAMDATRQAALCAAEYRLNMCDVAVPAMLARCGVWKTCAAQTSTKTGRTVIAAEIAGETLNALVESMSWRSLSFILASTYGCYLLAALQRTLRMA
ncbi:Di-sulfide bridge nucleocytoplasmic transport domain-containing protein [Schizophyllum amplum]|uniref:Di-sulfide bridge nucleocytoplasmic transport domain-containing protein n=1 Tax=Schizophyllum amplum TaxID=97359 RepID=A0A550BSW8_9AGAR|nr:Di-sulfide bridge nucleocytoplasmic transport domain-containing protein [Auriculariopsis ampla]